MGAVSLAILALAALSLGLSAVAIRRDTPPDWRFAVPEPLAADSVPRFETLLDYRAVEEQAHSPAIVTRDGGLGVIWFQGSAEARPDVDIHGVEIRRQGAGWQVSQPARILTRPALSTASRGSESTGSRVPCGQ